MLIYHLVFAVQKLSLVLSTKWNHQEALQIKKRITIKWHSPGQNYWGADGARHRGPKGQGSHSHAKLNNLTQI
jgi:hypothetical protein